MALEALDRNLVILIFRLSMVVPGFVLRNETIKRFSRAKLTLDESELLIQLILLSKLVADGGHRRT